MLEKRKEYFLNHFFAVVGTQPEGHQVPEKTAAELLEEANDLVFQADIAREELRNRGYPSQPECGILQRSADGIPGQTSNCTLRMAYRLASSR